MKGLICWKQDYSLSLSLSLSLSVSLCLSHTHIHTHTHTHKHTLWDASRFCSLWYVIVIYEMFLCMVVRPWEMKRERETVCVWFVCCRRSAHSDIQSGQCCWEINDYHLLVLDWPVTRCLGWINVFMCVWCLNVILKYYFIPSDKSITKHFFN